MDKLERWRSYLTHGCADHQHDLHREFHDAVLPDDGRRHRWYGDSREWVEKQRRNCFDQCGAGNRLPFYQLEWERHRFLHRHEQSSLNYNERTYHGDGDFHS